MATWGTYGTAAGMGLVTMLLAGHGIRAPARVLLAACPLVAIWGKASSNVWAAVKPKGRARMLCSYVQGTHSPLNPSQFICPDWGAPRSAATDTA